MGEANMENVWTMRQILKIMKLISSLKANFEKCCLLGVNLSSRKLEQMAKALRCKIGNLPFSYLGISVGVHHKRDSEWKGVVLKVRSRLKKKGSLWGKVIDSKYGGELGKKELSFPRGVNNKMSGWWRDIVKLTSGNEGEWFNGELERVLGDWNGIQFWEEEWAGEESLKAKVPRLFNLCLDNEGSVSSMGTWDGDIWNWEIG
ncbi:hypothetical protein ACS0TY_026684 [Phlomoides rotata]